MTVNWNHPWLAKYADYITHFKGDAVNLRSGKKEEKNESARDMAVSAVYKVNRMLKNVFLAVQMDPEALYTLGDARSALSAYLNLHALIDETNPSLVVRNGGRSEE